MDGVLVGSSALGGYHYPYLSAQPQFGLFDAELRQLAPISAEQVNEEIP